MKIAGEATLNAPVERVWDALLDPNVLVATIPGCEQLQTTGENAYAMTVTAGVASIKGTYAGTCSLSDLREHTSLVLSAEGAGAPGTIATNVDVAFAAGEEGTTRVTYEADATVGGMIAGVGQRMLSSVSKRMAAEFFGNVESVLTGGLDTAPAGAPAGSSPVAGRAASDVSAPSPGGEVFTAPAAAPAGGQEDFVKGVAVGAGLVLLGVVAGAVASRRRG